MIVRFTAVEEFCDEIRDRGPNLEPLVRATHRWERDPQLSMVSHQYVVGTFLRSAGSLTYVVMLKKYVGDVVKGEVRTNEPVAERAEIIMTTIRNATDAAGYACVPGLYEEDAP